MVDAMVEELHAYASDPANYPGSAGTNTGNATPSSGGAYEAYASQSPAQKRERLQRRLQSSHGALMRKLAELRREGGEDGDDGRFLTWVAATILNPDGAVIRRVLAESENDSDNNDDDEAEGEEEVEQILSARLVEALDGLAASVRDCLSSDGGGGEAQPSRAMLRVLLERNGASLSNDNSNNNNDDDDDDLLDYLALPGRVRAALGTAPGPGNGAITSTSGRNKRRRLHLHGGGYAASSSSASRTAKVSTTATAVAETMVAAVLSYVLAEYLASASCPFFVDSDSSAENGGPPSPTWDLLRACTVHVASEMGLAAFLPAVRAGLVCYGLDRLADDAAAAGALGMMVEEEDDEEEEGDGGESKGRIIVEGLSPVAVVDLILSDSG